MDVRQKQLLDLNTYIESVDQDLTDILENLQWERSYLLEREEYIVCKYDPNHTIPVTKMGEHEKKCFLKTHGYFDGDIVLPDPPGNNCNTCIQLGKAEIAQIINTAANGDPTFKKGPGPQGPEPMTLQRLQSSYTADERRAIHDAVVAASPSCHDLSDLALLSVNGEQQKTPKAKSRMEVLAELRDMKRRRTKYRVAAKTKNYSDVLRDVIKTQMEIYKETQDDIASNTIILNDYITADNTTERISHNMAEASHIEIEESHSHNIHGSKSKERFREDYRSSSKYIEDYKVKHISRIFGERSSDTSRSRNKYGSGYNNGDAKHISKSKEESRKRSYGERDYRDEERRSKSRFRSGDGKKIEEETTQDKRHRSDTQVKYKGRSEDYQRNHYSDLDKRDGEVRHRRYYDTFDRKEFNDERRRRNK